MNTDQTPIDENDSETIARVLAESGEPVAPASETPTPLDRWGFPQPSLTRPVPCSDGYWTPWHIANDRARATEARVAALESERATSIEHTGKLLAASEAGAAALREFVADIVKFARVHMVGSHLAYYAKEFTPDEMEALKAALATDAGAATLKRIELLEAANGAVERIAMERNQFEKEAKDARAKLAEAQRMLGGDNEGAILISDLTEQCQDLGKQLTASRALADRLGEALECDAMWAFDKEPPKSMRCEYPTGGALTSGPNNCREFYEKRKAAIAAWKEAK